MLELPYSFALGDLWLLLLGHVEGGQTIDGIPEVRASPPEHI
jgi:hypothetical protein